MANTAVALVSVIVEAARLLENGQVDEARELLAAVIATVPSPGLAGSSAEEASSF